jgi:predicted RNase H-like HicB family nuclease
MAKQATIKAIVRAGDQSGYVAECVEVHVVTQGETLDAVVHNLREAVALQLEGEDPAEWGLVEYTRILITYEMEPVGGSA